MEEEKPIVVTDDTLVEQMAAFGRYVLTAGGAFALGRGYIADDTLAFLTGLATVFAPMAYGIYKAWSNKRKLIITADAAPNSVAQVK